MKFPLVVSAEGELLHYMEAVFRSIMKAIDKMPLRPTEVITSPYIISDFLIDMEDRSK
jgi:hypothetical protein